MEQAANLICSLQQTLSEIDSVVANVNERSKRTILHIETAAQRLLQTITEHRHELVSKVCGITEAKLQALQAEKENVQDNFRAVENVLRCAQNTCAVEDSVEWENALSRQLSNMEGQVFDFQEYDEDLKFHFLYRDENLLAAICKFGDVFTIANDEHPPKTEVQETGVSQPKTEDMEEDVEETDLSNDIVLTDIVEGKPLLMEFQGNFSSPDQNQPVNQTNLVEGISQLFQENVSIPDQNQTPNQTNLVGEISQVFQENISNPNQNQIETQTSFVEGISQEFEENLSSPDQNQTATQVNFVEGISQVFEETVDVTRLKDDTKNCKKSSEEDTTSSVKTKEQIDSKVTEDEKMCDFTNPVEKLSDADSERYSDENTEGTASATTEQETVQVMNDLKNNDAIETPAKKSSGFSLPD